MKIEISWDGEKNQSYLKITINSNKELGLLGVILDPERQIQVAGRRFCHAPNVAQKSSIIDLVGNIDTQKRSVERIIIEAAKYSEVELYITPDAGKKLSVGSYLPYVLIQQALVQCSSFVAFPQYIGGDGYASLISGDHVWCQTKNSKPKAISSNQFKLHIAINDTQNLPGKMDPNLELGYNIADQILRQYHVWSYKVVLPGIILEKGSRHQEKGHPSQARKQMTIYSGDEGDERKPVAWEEVMDEIALTFVEKNIEPKPKYDGEQDVCVPGSSYITYRSENIDRGLGQPYKKPNERNPLESLRLSDIFYKELLSIINNEKQITEKLIIDLVSRSGIKSSNLDRVIKHLRNYENPNNAKFQPLDIITILQKIKINLDMAVTAKQQVTDINAYERFTSYSKAAATYNQLVLDVYEKILTSNNINPEQNTVKGKEIEIAEQWRNINAQWEQEVCRATNCKVFEPSELNRAAAAANIFLVPHQCDKIAALTSTYAMNIYAKLDNDFDIFILMRLEIDKIKALTSPEALQALSIKHVRDSFTHLANFTADKIQALLSPEAVSAYVANKTTIADLEQYDVKSIQEKLHSNIPRMM